ncbi:MAG: hypothetical protein CFH21_00701 [Alphaproteobacteria bacterium MarineAlpha5_Bin11]|nr:BolA family transcriptional regulator [Pelagibacteraceae bacterium]PPR43694.1 MAG: hypothetical protein CFH21_00701 [Alphaproteobacteria bacterium MarineAlpha5_Bin11]PPR51346.1 MAG: hypothetical protein CFH20_00661 [Alphaproteobacteria bacterium MarineAlpha5_Bin10]|tara:strand:- start:1132 stop:1368 length:237 start_codon:yes stop_codon:yes gene_type:complete
MPINKNKLEELLAESLPNAEIWIEDLRGDGDHYSATIISSDFKGKSRIEQHKMVYNALGDKMGTELHALMLKTSSEKI